MSLWPSRGLDVHGFEIKASRADWLREVKDPAKAEKIARFCDFWWVVVGDASIVQAGELPPTWGLLIPRGTGLKVAVNAPKRVGADLGRPFVAALVRRFYEHEHSIDGEAISAAVQEAKKRWEAQRQQEQSETKRELDELRDSIRRFQEVSGVRITRYDGDNIGEAVRLALSERRMDAKARLVRLRAVAAGVVEELDRALTQEVDTVA